MAPAPTADARGEIVRAATRLFAAHGFEATSLQAVAEAVGVTKQAVLHHFTSKEHLRAAVLEAMLVHWNEALPRLLLAASASDERFETVFGALVAFFSSDPDRARLLVREALDRPREMRDVLRGPVRPWIGAVARYIEKGQEAGRHFSDVDPEAYVLHVVLLVITATAAQAVMSAGLSSGTASRLEAELPRLARAALFRPAELAEPDAAPPRPKASKPAAPRRTRKAPAAAPARKARSGR
jgi:TetR/AcrR family transcriptional regulator